MHFMVDAHTKLNLEEKYEKTSGITSQLFCCSKMFPLSKQAIIRLIYEGKVFVILLDRIMKQICK